MVGFNRFGGLSLGGPRREPPKLAVWRLCAVGRSACADARCLCPVVPGRVVARSCCCVQFGMARCSCGKQKQRWPSVTKFRQTIDGCDPQSFLRQVQRYHWPGTTPPTMPILGAECCFSTVFVWLTGCAGRRRRAYKRRPPPAPGAE